MALFPRLQSKKGKDNTLSTSQNLDPGAWLQKNKKKRKRHTHGTYLNNTTSHLFE